MLFSACSFTASLTALAAVARAASVPVAPQKCPNNPHFANNPSCCNWYSILDDMQQNLFDNGSCGEEAHESLRLTFHDAIGYSQTANLLSFFSGRKTPGGADGSIIMFEDIEQEYEGNAGVQDIAEELKAYADSYKVTYGDIIQFAGIVGLANCPGSPRVKFWAGRPNATMAAPASMLPEAFHSGTQLLTRMADASFSPDEVVALMASHSTGRQDNQDLKRKGESFDTTPNKMDTQFYLETLLKGKPRLNLTQVRGSLEAAIDGQFRLQSDAAIARHPLTACAWQSMIDNQSVMTQKFGAAMEKLSLLGQNKARLLDCSEVIPVPASLNQRAYYPKGTSEKDVDAACKSRAWPKLETQA